MKPPAKPWATLITMVLPSKSKGNNECYPDKDDMIVAVHMSAFGLLGVKEATGNINAVILSRRIRATIGGNKLWISRFELGSKRPNLGAKPVKMAA